MVELIWDGKYDKDGKRVAPLRVKLPFQNVETVSESAQQRQMSLDLGAGRQSEWRNRLIWGDKKYVLPSLLDEFAGKVDLIYIDPPFNVGADFSYTATIPDIPETEVDETATFVKEPSAVEMKAYRDTWGRGLDSYLKWLFETMVLLQQLLNETGSVFVHLDHHVAYYAKVVLDEVFGTDNFRNEIILPGRAVKNLQQQFDEIQRLQVRHDVMFWYSKSATTRFQAFWIQKHNIGNIEGHWHHFWSTADRPTMRYELFGVTPPTGQWVWKKERALKAYDNYQRFIKEAGGRELAHYWRDTGSSLEFVRPAPDDGRPQYWREPAETRIADTVWSGIPIYSSRYGYPTEKSEALIEEIFNLASHERDLALDCFCGSGTTAAVAEKLNRRWIACDLGRFSIHTTRKRLLGIQDIKPFVVQNLGKYERQTWQAAEFGDKKQAEAVQAQYRKFILELYGARPIEGYAWLHGIKDGRMVHVGSVDSPVAPNDITQIAIEFKKAIGTGKDAPKVAAVDVLGWDFAFEINEIGIQQAKEAGITLRCLKIPREVMDPKAVEQGDVKFFELAALSVKTKTKKQELTLELTDFTIPPDDVPEDVQKAIKHWSQWIDYWAVDWDNRDDTFHNQWQTYRTRQDPSLKLETSHVYEEPGEYIVMVKVIDILGNDTTKVLKVKV